jgi:hypothetical protein
MPIEIFKPITLTDLEGSNGRKIRPYRLILSMAGKADAQREIRNAEVMAEAQCELGDEIEIFDQFTTIEMHVRTVENPFAVVLIWYRENEPDATGEDSFGLITALGID